MFEQSPFLVPPYSALADIYDRAGFSNFARDHVLDYVMYAQSIDWVGRRVLDLGCGTGVSTWLLAQHDLRVAAIDASASMLAQAEAKTERRQEEDAVIEVYNPPSFHQMDLRELESPMGAVDLVLAVGGVLNAIQSLRELELIFRRVHAVLDHDKLFMFDLRTIRGLSTDPGTGDHVFFDNGFNLTVIIRSRFSFETLSNTNQVIIYQQQGMAWERKDELHVERGYPVQGIAALLERVGFTVIATLGPDFTPFDSMSDSAGRVVFVAQKSASASAR